MIPFLSCHLPCLINQSPECFFWSLTPNEHPTKTIHDDSAACNWVPRFFLWDNHQWPNWSLQYFSGASPQLCVRQPIAVSQPNLPEHQKTPNQPQKLKTKIRSSMLSRIPIDLEDCSPHDQPAASQQQQIKHKHYMPWKSMIQTCCWARQLALQTPSLMLHRRARVLQMEYRHWFQASRY